MKTQPSDIIAAVEAFNRAWEAADIEAALAHCTPDVVYMLHMDKHQAEHGGCWVGRDEVRTLLQRLRDRFEFEVYHPTILGSSGDTVRQSVEFSGIHRPSRIRLSLRCRQVIIVRHGKIFQSIEYHDGAKLQAFFRMVAGERTPAASSATGLKPAAASW